MASLSHISPTDFDPTLNLVGRPNVLVKQQTNPKAEPQQTCKALYLTLDRLTTMKPNWRFSLANPDSRGGNRVYSGCTITEDGEPLGSIAIHYHGRHYKIRVNNERINAARERGTGYHTEDPSKAELRIRKTFFKQTTDESLAKAIEVAGNVVNRQASHKSYECNMKFEGLLRHSKEYAEQNFADYMKCFPAVQSLYEPYQKAKEETLVTTSVREALDNGTATVVVFNGTHYIVKSNEGTKTLTDGELSYDTRRKLGLLKLVKDHQMISDVGCKVDNSIFVLMPEVKEQE